MRLLIDFISLSLLVPFVKLLHNYENEPLKLDISADTHPHSSIRIHCILDEIMYFFHSMCQLNDFKNYYAPLERNSKSVILELEPYENAEINVDYIMHFIKTIQILIDFSMSSSYEILPSGFSLKSLYENLGKEIKEVIDIIYFKDIIASYRNMLSKNELCISNNFFFDSIVRRYNTYFINDSNQYLNEKLIFDRNYYAMIYLLIKHIYYRNTHNLFYQL